MAIAEINEVKALIGIGLDDTSYDAYLNAAIPIVETQILDYMNNDFRSPVLDDNGDPTYDANGEIIYSDPVYPQPLKRAIAEICRHNLPSSKANQKIESERFGKYSVKYVVSSQDIPDAALQILNNYRKSNWE